MGKRPLSGANREKKEMSNSITAGVCRRIFNVAAVTTLMTAALGAAIWTHQGDGQMFDLDHQIPQVEAQIVKNNPGADMKAVDAQLKETAYEGELAMRAMSILFTGISLANTLYWRGKMKTAEGPRNTPG
jgi:hypothetical protein